jgi:cellulose synthase operon protein C
MRHSPFLRGLTTVLFVLLSVAGCDATTAEEHLTRAEARAAGGNLNAAIIELKNSLQKAPDFVPARILLGDLQVRLGNFEEGLIELERAYDLGAEREAVLPGILHAKVRLGRHQEVLGELHDDAGLPPDLEVVRGDALLAAGDPDAASAAYRRALEREPGNVGAVLGLARVSWQAGEHGQAREYFTTLAAAPEVTADALLTLAEFELSQGNVDDARRAFEEAVRVPGLDHAAWIGLARSHLAQGDPEGALRAVNRVLDMHPTLPAANYLLGLIHFQTQQYDLAEAALRRAHQHAPDHPQTTLLLGIVKVHQRQFSQAQDLLLRFLAFDRTNLTARKMLAGIHLEQDNPARAAEVLRSQPDDMMDAQAWSLLGTADLRAGNVKQATAAFQAAIDMAPAQTPATADPASQLVVEPQVGSARTENQMMLLVALLRDNRFDEAMAAARRLIEEQPDSPLAYNFLGAAHIGLGDAAAAERAFVRALELDPGYHPAATNLAQLELQRNNPEGAAQRYQTLLETDPGNLPALLGLAQMALATGDAESANRLLTEAAGANPQAVEPRLIKAQLAYGAGDRGEARRHTDDVLSLDPDHVLGLLLRARLDMDANQPDRAGPTVDRLQRRLADVPGVRPDVLFRLAQIQLQLGRNEVARSNLNRAITTDPTHTDALTVLAQIEISQSNWAPARTLIDRVRSAAPDRPLHLVLEGDLYRARGDLQRAEGSYREAADRGSRDAVFRLVALHQRAGRSEDVVAVLRPRAEAAPDDTGLLFALANALLDANRLDEARTEYERLLQRLPQNPIVLNNLAWIYHEQRDGRARRLAEQAHELAPESAAIMDTLGVILLAAGEVERARDLLARAAAASGDNPTIRYHLATAHRHAGDTAGARSVLVDLLSSETEFPERERARALLADLD